MERGNTVEKISFVACAWDDQDVSQMRCYGPDRRGDVVLSHLWSGFVGVCVFNGKPCDG